MSYKYLEFNKYSNWTLMFEFMEFYLFKYRSIVLAVGIINILKLCSQLVSNRKYPNNQIKICENQ